MININNSNTNRFYYNKRNAQNNIKSLKNNNIHSNLYLKKQKNKTTKTALSTQANKYNIAAKKSLVNSLRPYTSTIIDGVTIKKSFIELFRIRSKYYDFNKKNPNSNVTWETYLRIEVDNTLQEFKTYLKEKLDLNYSELSTAERNSLINSQKFKFYLNKGKITNSSYCGKGTGSYFTKTGRKGIIKTAAKNVKI